MKPRNKTNAEPREPSSMVEVSGTADSVPRTVIWSMLKVPGAPIANGLPGVMDTMPLVLAGSANEWVFPTLVVSGM